MEIYDNIKAVCLALAGCVITSLAGCSGGQGEISLPRPFPVPEVPSIISSGEDAMEYLAMHYWDGYTDTSAFYPCDSTMVNGVAEKDLEQAFADWTSIILKTGPEHAGRAVSSLFDRISAVETKDTSSTVFETVSALAYKYFYDPNSPVRSEDLYLPFVSRMAAYGGFTPEQRMRYEYDARMCSLNRTGTPAADFTFSDGQGRMHTLYSLDAEYTLLFFSNPGCEACKYIIGRLESDPVLGSMVSSGRLAVANIYIDEDLVSWHEYLKEYPDRWYNGYDPSFTIRTDLLYNVRAIPSLYLLDRDKTVLLKDAPEDRVFAALHAIAGQ